MEATLLSKLELEQYENDGYVIPDFKMPEYLLKKIEERHDELLETHPEFKIIVPQSCITTKVL